MVEILTADKSLSCLLVRFLHCGFVWTAYRIESLFALPRPVYDPRMMLFSHYLIRPGLTFRLAACLCVMVFLMAFQTGCDRLASQSDKGVTDPNVPVILGKQSNGNASISINLEGTERTNFRFDYVDFEAGSTVLDLLKKAAVEKEFDLQYSGNGETAFVKAIDGVVGGQDNQGWWIYLVNNELAHQGAGVVTIKDGDQIEWRLGTYRPELNSSDDPKSSDQEN